MAQCRWPDGSCPNPATTVVYRMATEEERAASEVVTDYGSKWTGLYETNVCDAHLEEAQKDYPHIANKEPRDIIAAMDLVTGIGLVMGILSTADLAYKYVPALFKKRNFSSTRQNDRSTGPLKKI